MRTTAILAPLLFAATSLSQAVEEGIAPSSPPPRGCEPNANGNFTIGTLKLGHKKRETAAQAAANGALTCTLKSGILRDRDGRTGSVVANHQFQFDGPPQAGAIYTGGFSICPNGSLAIGGTTRWWQCNSGPFNNLYDQWIGDQCEEIRIQVSLLDKPVTSSSSSDATAKSSSAPVASVQSSLATISGAPSTVSKSAIGPSASFGPNSTVTSGGASGASSALASATRSLASGASASAGAGASGAAPAPPAGGAASSFDVSLLGAGVVVLGAALML